MNEFAIILPARLYGTETAKEFTVKGDIINTTHSGTTEIKLLNGVTIAVLPSTAVIIRKQR